MKIIKSNLYRSLFVLLAICFGSSIAIAEPVKNSEIPRVGISNGIYKIGGGVMYHHALKSDNYSITGELERMVTDHNGLLLGFNAGVISEDERARSYHGFAGTTLHAFPNSVFDVYLGGRGGFTQIFRGKNRTVNPTVNVFLGSSVYFSEWYIDLEIGYAVYGRGIDNELYEDHSAIRSTVKFGYSW